MNDAAQAVMAVSFFGSIAIIVRSIAGAWGKRADAKRTTMPTEAMEQRLARIENAVDVIALEVERIAEAQRFATRLAAERDALRVPGPSEHVPEGRVITPH